MTEPDIEEGQEKNVRVRGYYLKLCGAYIRPEIGAPFEGIQKAVADPADIHPYRNIEDAIDARKKIPEVWRNKIIYVEVVETFEIDERMVVGDYTGTE